MASHFSNAEWDKINTVFKNSAEDFGLPKRRKDSVIIGSFNIRKLGRVDKRTDQSWEFLKQTISRFDLIAIQEVMDGLEGLEHLSSLLGNDYCIAITDVTGATPGKSGNAERLGYLYNKKKIERTALASDISFDRSEIINNLFDNRELFNQAFDRHSEKIVAWEKKVLQRKAIGKRAPSKPNIEIPTFLAFIRQPQSTSFRINGAKNTTPYEFIVVNAHLLYGTNKKEREWEFKALIEWLSLRAKYIDKLYHPNLLLLGDCNLDFDSVPAMKENIEALLTGLNKTVLKNKKAAVANFPLLSAHPKNGILKTALRQKATYDQIGIFSNDPRLPKPADNANAGSTAAGYDYGVFNMANLIAQALHGKNIDQLSKPQKKALYKKAEFDISDHMPIWMRLKLPE